MGVHVLTTRRRMKAASAIDRQQHHRHHPLHACDMIPVGSKPRTIRRRIWRYVRPGTKLPHRDGRMLKEANSLSFNIKMRHQDIPWDQVRGMYKRLAHNYSHVDREVAWGTIRVFPTRVAG